MPNKKKGGLFIFSGILLILVSCFSDYLRNRPLSFGPAQILLVVVGLGIITLGFYTFWRCDLLSREDIRKLGPFKIIVNGLLLVAIVLLLFYPIKYLTNWVSYPYLLGYRDIAVVYPAVGLANGINPYALQSFPEFSYVYGALFVFIMAPFMGKAANPLLVAHWSMLVFLIAFLILAFWFLRKRKASIIGSLIGVLVFLNAVCLLWYLDALRPDIAALFFGFAAFYLFFKDKPNSFDLFLSALLCVLSFYCKQYLLFSAAIIAIYLFLFVSKQKGLLYVLYTAVLGAGSFLVFCHFFPMYYNYSIIHHLSMYNDYNIEHMVMQSRDFFRFFWPLCLFLLIALHKKISNFDFRALLNKKMFSLKWKDPLILSFKLDFWIIGLVGSALILTFWLGRHSLSYYAYYCELLLPYLVFLVIPEVDHYFSNYPHQVMMQIILLGFCVLPFRSRFQLNSDASRQGFDQLFAQAGQCTNIYDMTPIAGVYKLENKMAPIYNNGQTEYAWSVFPKNISFAGKYSIITDQEIQQRLDEWEKGIFGAIERQEFDCIISEVNDPIENYSITAEIPGVLGMKLYLFTPQSR